MKLKSLFAAALAVIALASCTKEVVKEVVIDKNGEPGVSYIKLNLSTEPGTRGVNDHDGARPTADELKIYNYAVFIFNSNGLLEASLSKSIYSSTVPTPPDNYTWGSSLDFDPLEGYNGLYMDDQQVITLSAGTKYFFAILNAPQSLLEDQQEYLANNSLTQQVAQNEVLTFEDLSLIVGSYYFESDPSTPEFDNDIATTRNRGFLMTSGRLESKTLLEMEEDDAPEEITLEVGRGMAKVSLASDLSGTVDEDQPNGVLDVLKYKVINNPKNMYVMPRYEGGVLVTPNYFYRQALTDSYVAANYFHSTTDYITTSENGNKTFTYCIENANLTPKKGNSTAVMLSGTYYPLITYDENDGNDITNNVFSGPGTTFWRVRNVNTKEYTPRYYREEPLDPNNVYGIEAGETYEAIKYPDGTCYYLVYLQNDKKVDEYSVYRNSYYNVDIVFAGGAGEPNEGDLIPDPDENIDPETFIKVNIKIAEWDVIDQPGKL